jgi:ribonucleotide monophosphatase NagD (HAD superfamily)
MPKDEAQEERETTPAAATVMVGDDAVTDVGGAIVAGLMGVLVRTGKGQGRNPTKAPTPHAVLDSIADLPDWWRRRTR